MKLYQNHHSENHDCILDPELKQLKQPQWAIRLLKPNFPGPDTYLKPFTYLNSLFVALTSQYPAINFYIYISVSMLSTAL